MRHACSYKSIGYAVIIISCSVLLLQGLGACLAVHTAHARTLRLHPVYSTSTRDDHTPSLLPDVPTIHMIMPTYSRWTQKADLTRLCQTLMHVKNLNWILVEDSDERTGLVTRFLKRCRVKSTHLNIRTKKELQRNVMATYIFLICIVRGTALCACLLKDLLL